MTQYWYNLYTQQVEADPTADYRKLLGPYDTREEAERALERAARNTERWDDEDAAYKGE